tara:strand:- start:3802 stop:4101 length:300 start_codon:yes stop_codon:yes gene_type:complete
MTRPNAFRIAMKHAPTYVTWVFYPDGMGSSDPYLCIDDAIDAYTHAKDAEYDAIVWKFDMDMYPDYTSSPTVTDVTDEARVIIRARVDERKLDLPDWLA